MEFSLNLFQSTSTHVDRDKYIRIQTSPHLAYRLILYLLSGNSHVASRATVAINNTSPVTCCPLFLELPAASRRKHSHMYVTYDLLP